MKNINKVKYKTHSIHYEARSEFGVKKFNLYKDLIDFLSPYWDRWLHKIRVFKIKTNTPFEGVYQKNNRWPVRFLK